MADQHSPLTWSEALVRGLFSTGYVSLASCLTTFVLGGFLVWRLISPDASVFADGSAGRWAESPRDFQAFATASAIGIAHRPEGPLPVVLAGTSLVRAAVGSPERTKEAIQSEISEPVEVAIVAAGANTLLHTLALLDVAFESRGGIAIIGLNEMTLGVSPQEQQVVVELSPLGFASRPARELAKTMLGDRPRIESFGPMAALRFYALRLRSFANNIWMGRRFEPEEKFSFERDPEGPIPMIPAAAWLRRAKTSVAGIEAHADRSMATLDAIASHFASRPDVTLVLLLDPLNLDGLDDPQLRTALQQARARLERFARERPIHLSSAFRDAALGPESFIDYGHIASEAGRVRLRQALAKDLARIRGVPAP